MDEKYTPYKKVAMLRIRTFRGSFGLVIYFDVPNLLS